MLGKVTIEDHFNLPDFAEKAKWWAGLFAVDADKHVREISDVDKIRLGYADEHGVSVLPWLPPNNSMFQRCPNRSNTLGD